MHVVRAMYLRICCCCPWKPPGRPSHLDPGMSGRGTQIRSSHDILTQDEMDQAKQASVMKRTSSLTTQDMCSMVRAKICCKPLPKEDEEDCPVSPEIKKQMEREITEKKAQREFEAKMKIMKQRLDDEFEMGLVNMDFRVLTFHVGMFAAPLNPYVPLLAFFTILGMFGWEWYMRAHYIPVVQGSYELCSSAMQLNTMVHISAMYVLLGPLDSHFQTGIMIIGMVYFSLYIGWAVQTSAVYRMCFESLHCAQRCKCAGFKSHGCWLQNAWHKALKEANRKIAEIAGQNNLDEEPRAVPNQRMGSVPTLNSTMADIQELDRPDTRMELPQQD